MTFATRSMVVVALLAGLVLVTHAQAPADLRERLTARFDVVALQKGVALVPLDAASTVKMIQIVDGVVTIDGQSLTGAQLRERLAADADLVLQVSYLDATQQRALGADGAGGGGATFEPAAPPAADQPVERTEIRRGDIIRFGDAVTIGRNERVEGDVVVFGDSADIDGEVTGDVTVFGDRLRLGPDAIVRGDVNAVGGSLDRAEGAQILGELNEVGRGRNVNMDLGDTFIRPLISRVLGVGATIFRLTVLTLVALIIVAFGRGAVESIGARTSATPARSGLIGLAAEILFLPVTVLTVVVLAVSIVGIPLLILVPFAILLVMLVALIGFVGLAYQVGGRLKSKFGRESYGAYGTVALGVLAIGLLTLLGKIAGLVGGAFLGMPITGIGYVVEYVAWTVGFGAALLYWYEMQPGWVGRRKAATAPVAPPPEA